MTFASIVYIIYNIYCCTPVAPLVTVIALLCFSCIVPIFPTNTAVNVTFENLSFRSRKLQYIAKSFNISIVLAECLYDAKL